MWGHNQKHFTGVIRGKPRRLSAFIVGAKRSREFTLGPEGFYNEGVYVLELPGRRYYVGKSNNIEERIRQHADTTDERGATCAKGFLRRVPTVTPRQADMESWERTETLTLMYRNGIGKVRGWFYTLPKLTPQDREHAFQQICEKFDLCRQCGKSNHFTNECTNRLRASFFFH